MNGWEKWTLYLAEADIEPEPSVYEELPGLRHLYERVWLHPGHPDSDERGVYFGTHPLYGSVYLRPFAKGEGLEALREHPATQHYLELLRNAYLAAYGSGELHRADGVGAKLASFGEDMALLKEKASALQKRYTLLKLSGAPVSIQEGRVFVGNPPVIAIEKDDEAEAISKLYAWAKREGVIVTPVGRGKKGDPLFKAQAFLLPADGNRVEIPITRTTRKPSQANPVPIKLSRNGRNLEAKVARSYPPKEVVVFYLPWAF